MNFLFLSELSKIMNAPLYKACDRKLKRGNDVKFALVYKRVLITERFPFGIEESDVLIGCTFLIEQKTTYNTVHGTFKKTTGTFFPNSFRSKLFLDIYNIVPFSQIKKIISLSSL